MIIEKSKTDFRIIVGSEELHLLKTALVELKHSVYLQTHLKPSKRRPLSESMKDRVEHIDTLVGAMEKIQIL